MQLLGTLIRGHEAKQEVEICQERATAPGEPHKGRRRERKRFDLGAEQCEYRRVRSVQSEEEKKKEGKKMMRAEKRSERISLGGTDTPPLHVRVASKCRRESVESPQSMK